MLHSTTQLKDADPPKEPLPFDKIEARFLQHLNANDDGAIDMADLLLAQAALHRSSDVHLDPWEDCVTVRFRIDGLLHEVAAFPRPHHEKVVGRIKVLSHLLTYQKDTPQDGRIDPENTPCGIATRVSTFPTVHGEKVVLRLLNSDAALFSLDALGFQADTVFRLRELIERPQGTILLTGPASSGKTTTIYALLQEIATRRGGVQIVTIEDPVEYRLPRISQTQVNPHGGFTFATALRSALRQDPEVIMVGEIRDPETAHVAIQAGLTGHLVISTIHSATAAGVFTRLLDMGIEPYLVASSVTGILSQRLLRTNCPHCLETYEPDLELLCRYGLGDARDALRRGAGCDQCRKIGYRGRTAVGELLMTDDTTAELVLARSRTAVLHEAVVETGMRTAVEDAVDRVRQGVTTIEEVRRVLPPTQEVAGMMEEVDVKAPRKSPQGGFSLLEMTAAIFILCFGVMGILTAYHFGLDKTRMLREGAIATEAVQNEIETLRAQPFDRLQDGEQTTLLSKTAGTEDLVNLTPAVSIKPHGEGLRLKEVRVSVRWTGDNGRTIEKIATTLIADKEGSIQ